MKSFKMENKEAVALRMISTTYYVNFKLAKQYVVYKFLNVTTSFKGFI
ncbi:hypothetical protein [Clostridium sp. KNHs214]|nr:hypothetical protein [Clostridium sp. KNHs214]